VCGAVAHLVGPSTDAGEPIADHDDRFGLSVTLAARIGDWGEPIGGYGRRLPGD
jgi:hypothetical protein